MDDTLTQVLLVCLVFGVIFGPLTARSSNRQQPILGGLIAQVFHLFASMTFVATLPGVLASLILGGGIRMAFPLAIGLTLTSLLFLLIHATFEPNQSSE